MTGELERLRALSEALHRHRDGCNGRPHRSWYRGENKCDTLARFVRDLLARDSAGAGLDEPYGGHPEFGPRYMANQANPSLAGWQALAEDALLAFDQCRAALSAPQEEPTEP